MKVNPIEPRSLPINTAASARCGQSHFRPKLFQQFPGPDKPRLNFYGASGHRAEAAVLMRIAPEPSHAQGAAGFRLGFTLIELLVVIATVVLLGSMLFTGLART